MTESQDHQDAGDGAVKSTDDARQGETTGHVRWMLRISLALGVVALGSVFIVFSAARHAPSTAHAPPAVAASARDAGAG